MKEPKNKKLTAKDVPAPEPPKMKLIKEDFSWTKFIFSLLIFGIGFAVGFTVRGNAL